MMKAALYRKTPKGWEEARERKHRLDHRTHTALMLVVGAKPASLLTEQWRAIGAPLDVEEVLVRGGFIESTALAAANAEHHEAQPSPDGVAHPEDVQHFLDAELFMEQTSMSTSGLRSYFFQLRLQRCETLDDLRELYPDYARVVARCGNERQTQVLRDEAKRLLRPLNRL
jgi:hypothetical protein